MDSGIKLTHHHRLFLLLLAFSWSIIIGFVVFQCLREKEYKSELLSAQLQLFNRHLLEVIDNGESYEDFITSHPYPFEDLRVSIVDFSGKVIYDNLLQQDSMDNHLNRPEIVTALKNGSGYHIGRQSISDGQQYFYSASKGDKVIVRTALPFSLPLHELLEPDWFFLWAMLLMCIVISILAYFTTRRISRSIERLNRFAKKARNGEPFDEAESFPNDELGSISKNIVRLYSQWQQTIKDRDVAYETAMREEQEKIRIKKELTNNINHELKTPVASMQVCLETLLSGIKLSEEKRQELIERCYANNDRLRRLLNDVSLITRMEDGGQRINREPVVINDILNEIVEELEMLPEEERMCMHVQFEKKVCVWGSLSLVTSIFQNLTENAIAHSGGKHIYVTLLEDNDNQCRIRFEDDGCGVDYGQLPHLFERFYRVDKGRSRRMGGTGLGLSIVKHAVQFHGGAIVAGLRPGGGLRFEFLLRKHYG